MSGRSKYKHWLVGTKLWVLHQLTRTPDENDRRVGNLALTRAGLTAYREMVPLAKTFERELLERLSAEERAAIVKGVAALEACLGQDTVGANHFGLKG